MLKILIADCEPLANEALSEFFNRPGYNVYSAKNIRDSGKISDEVIQFKPNAALLDIRIGKTLKLEVLDIIKKIDSNIKIIVMSVYSVNAEKDMLQTIMGHGADEESREKIK